MILKKGIPVIDQGDKLGFWGGKLVVILYLKHLKNL